MFRIFCALLVSLCLTACGTGQADPSSEQPQESLLEQELEPVQPDTQTPTEEETAPEQNEPPVTVDTEKPLTEELPVSDKVSDSSSEQTIPPAPLETTPSQSEELPGTSDTYETGTIQEEPMLKITVGDYEFTATFDDNSSAEEFRELLTQGPVTVEMEDYGGFEKVGALGTTLTRNDTQITTQPGDVILYQGNQITIYYGTNTWSFTRLAQIDDPTGLQEKLGAGAITVIFSLA